MAILQPDLTPTYSMKLYTAMETWVRISSDILKPCLNECDVDIFISDLVACAIDKRDMQLLFFT